MVLMFQNNPPTWSEECWIYEVWAIGGCNYYHPLEWLDAIELYRNRAIELFRAKAMALQAHQNHPPHL